MTYVEPGYGDRDTDVVARRVVQYVIDAVLSSILPWLSALLFLLLPTRYDGSVDDPGLTAAVSLSVVVLAIVIYVGYWVVVPAKWNGQTVGMKVMGVRVVNADGGEADMVQMLVRWILLVVDGLVAGLVGLVAMLVTDRHQRLGDMAARTLVIRA
ncbi:RDD family protein [Nocardiopsis mangrovi]|uniref:RDD family protein n=1 Tax=Nocardiopsis mangrovi TaxID=1179818 RepID=A0ABV9DR90_9ACTN